MSGYHPASRDSSLAYFTDHHADAIHVVHEGMKLAFPAGTTDAAIAKHLKAVDAATRQARKLAKDGFARPTITSYGKSANPAKPSKLLLDAAARGSFSSWDDRTAYTGSGRNCRDGLAVIPDSVLHAGLLEKARKELAKWPTVDPLNAPKFISRCQDPSRMAAISTEHLEKVVASNLKPGARIHGQFAATLVYGIAELERRATEVAEVA